MQENPEIVYVEVESLTEWANNPRENDDAVPEVARSIKEFGMLQPLVVDQFNVVYAGNTRLKACKVLGIKRIPIVRAEHLSPEQLKAYAIADNKTHELAKWDHKKLVALVPLAELQEIPGFGTKDIERLNTLLLQQAHIPKIPEEKGVSKVTHECPKCHHTWTA